jgi:hypothetical protein
MHGQFALHGVDPLISLDPPSRRLDNAEHCLPTGMDVDVLDRDLLSAHTWGGAAMARWTPLPEVLARAGSPEVLIRRCQEKFVVIRFAHAAYTNREGQPRRDDMTVPYA